MRIIRLQAEGFKRLVAVDITPEGDLIEIRGNNGEGKSSVLDAIFAALAGAEAAPIKPVRTGEEYAIIRVLIGDGTAVEYVVTRYFDKDGTTSLKVTNADGSARFDKGQTMLDNLVGSIAFDPLAFRDMKPEDQAAEIRRLVKLDVDLDALAAADKADFEKRRDVNRDAKALKARIEAIVVPADIPKEAPDKAAIVAELEGAAETNSGIERERLARQEKGRRIGEIDRLAADRDEEADELERRVTSLRAAAEAARAEAMGLSEGLAALPPLAAPVDTSAVRVRLDEAERLIELCRRRDERAALSTEFEALKSQSEGLTAAMDERATARERALAAAEMPIPGLGFASIGDELHVTLAGEPFSQASSAEQLRASTAIAIVANPKLRVIRIKDGSLLDKNGLKLLAEIAAEHDCQIWGEFVGDEGAGIIMEAGAVKGAPEPERVEPPKRRKKAEGEGGPTASPDPATVAAGLNEAVGGAKATDATIAAEADRQKAAAPKPERKRPQALDEIVTPPTGQLL